MSRYILILTVYAGHKTYGVGYVEYDDGRPVLIASVPDLSPDKSAVKRFVRSCNSIGLDPRDLRALAKDFLESL